LKKIFLKNKIVFKINEEKIQAKNKKKKYLPAHALANHAL
jgi:hypothetical protein